MDPNERSGLSLGFPETIRNQEGDARFVSKGSRSDDDTRSKESKIL